MPKKTTTAQLPDWLDADLWREFLAHRKALKKPMTDYAQTLAFKVLERFRSAGHDAAASVEQSILNGWQGLFEPRADFASQRTTAARPMNRQEALEARNLEIGMAWASKQEANDACH